MCSSVKSVSVCAFAEMVFFFFFFFFLSHCSTSLVLSWKCQSLREVIAVSSGPSEGESSK